MSNPWTAPLKRNWKPGIPQVAAFLRATDGGTVSVCHDQATKDEQQLVIWLVVGTNKMSEALRELLRAEWEALKQE